MSASKFYGRENELKEMHDFLNPKVPGRKMVVIWGLPGFGKTQLAIHYQSILKNEYSHVIWADASSLGTIQHSFLDVARQIDQTLAAGTDITRAVSTVKRFLAKPDSGRWLMILDSYDNDSFDIRTFFPSGGMWSGSLLVTSVRSKMAYHLDARSIEVKGLDENAGREILFHQKRIVSPSNFSR